MKNFLIFIINFSFQGLVKAETWSIAINGKMRLEQIVEERKGNNFLLYY